MRLFLLPITTRRSLLFCQRIHVTTTDKQGLVDKITSKTAKVWASWEKKEKGWQKKLVEYGNYGLRRIPYEEWGLKSVPPISARRKDEELQGRKKVELTFPGAIIPPDRVEELLKTMATERDALHRKRLIWCCIGLPITAPFALVPVIPNVPFFYLAYRAWSHWRALAGGDHLEFLIKNKLLHLNPSRALDDIYEPLLPAATSKSPKRSTDDSNDSLSDQDDSTGREQVLLSQDLGRRITETLELPELEVEMERAIWQVSRAAEEATTKEEGRKQ